MSLVFGVPNTFVKILLTLSEIFSLYLLTTLVKLLSKFSLEHNSIL